MNIEEAVSLKFTVLGSGRYRRTKEHDSLVLDTDRNIYFWNSRGEGGSTEQFLVKHMGIDRRSAANMASPPMNFAPKKNHKLHQNLSLLFYKSGLNRRDFWYTRGYTDDVIDLYMLGYFNGSYSIPFIMDGQTLAIQLRKKGFVNQVEGSELALFGYDQLVSNKIFVVESPLDVPIMRMFGYDAVSHNYGGNKWDYSWNELFVGKQVYFIPDNDKVGYLHAKRSGLNCWVCIWPRVVEKGFDITKLYKNSPEMFEKNLKWLVDNSVHISML